MVGLSFDILEYQCLQKSSLKKQYDKVIEQLKRGDFRSSDVKKLKGRGFFRAKLNDASRLLFRFAKHDDRPILLICEVIHNHNYNKSAFLKGSKIDESDFEIVQDISKLSINSLKNATTDFHDETNPCVELPYYNKRSLTFHVLDKVISFDETQTEIYLESLPLILIGSAGSGKTALALEKLKTCYGRILYTSLSSYLVENAESLLYKFTNRDDNQEIEFKTFQELIETIEIQKNRCITYRDFHDWIISYRSKVKQLGGTRKLYEEFQGVIAGSSASAEYLSEDEYLALGIKQSIFNVDQRQQVYDLYRKYLKFLDTGIVYDPQIIASRYRLRAIAQYDALIVDEVQDFTVSQLSFVFEWLKEKSSFILTGDANQIVHPNFFSWSRVKTFFYKEQKNAPEIIRILRMNFRNSPEVTNLANKLLLLKQKKFGSIDKDSNYLAHSATNNTGSVSILKIDPTLLRYLDESIRRSVSVAVIVLNDEDKDEVRKIFSTPLIFSVHEAKGLEYPYVILYRFISSAAKEFTYLTEGAEREQLVGDLQFARSRDKSDKSLEVHKFYINSLYVGITRGICNVILIEDTTQHPIISLLDLQAANSSDSIKVGESSHEDWEKEAHRLEKQGKLEQAKAIHSQVLKIESVPWPVPSLDTISEHVQILLKSPTNRNSQRDLLAISFANGFDRLLFFLAQTCSNKIACRGYKYISNYMFDQHYEKYTSRNLLELLTRKYGIDFRNEIGETPLMVCVQLHNAKFAETLVERGASCYCVTLCGLNAARLVLRKFFIAQEFISTKQQAELISIYDTVALQAIRLRTGGRLVKLERRFGEYLIFEAIFCSLLALRSRQSAQFRSTTAVALSEVFSKLPDEISLPFRKARKYISAILAKSEINSNHQYSRRFLERKSIGYYTFPKDLEIEVFSDIWVNWLTFMEDCIP